jgi:alpha-mannosidase
VQIDPATGRIARLVHKATGADVAAPGRAHLCVIEDTSDTWGHDVVAYDDVIGEFACTSVRLVEHGPVRSVLRVESAYGASRLREDYILGADSRYVDVVVTLDWHERLKLLKLRYPTSIESACATYEVPYGHLERESGGHEEPGQSWVDVSGDGSGLTVINDGKSGYDVQGADLGISAVRSPVWAWHDPRELERGGDFEYMDQGRQRFRVRLVPHAGDWRQAEVPRLAAELNQPPHVMFESFHPGPLPARRSFANDGGGSFVVTVVKGAEDGDGYVLRGYETAGQKSAVSITLFDRTFSLDVEAHEIATIRVPRDLSERVRKTNLLEQ